MHNCIYDTCAWTRNSFKLCKATPRQSCVMQCIGLGTPGIQATTLDLGSEATVDPGSQAIGSWA